MSEPTPRQAYCVKCKCKTAFRAVGPLRVLRNGVSAQQTGTCGACGGKTSWIGRP